MTPATALHPETKGMRCLAGMLVVASALLHTGAAAEDGELEARYQREREACQRIANEEERSTCLQDAAAAFGEARKGQLSDPQATYEKNALARCEMLPAADRDLCRRRTRGEGMTTGSVAEGGIYREYRVITLPGNTPREAAEQPARER